MGGGGRGWVALEAALAPARPRVAMSWRSRLVRPALVPLLWTVGSRWGRGVFVRCVSPVGRACAAWHSAPGAEGAASPKSGRSAAPAPPRAPAPPVRLPSAFPAETGKAVCLSPCGWSGIWLFLNGGTLSRRAATSVSSGSLSYLSCLQHHPSGRKCGARPHAEGASVQPCKAPESKRFHLCDGPLSPQ